LIKIEKITIKGIKSHQNTTISLEDYNTIVGENNSGKSNILFAILWFFNEIKIQKDNITTGYFGMPSVKILFSFDEDEVPQNVFNEEYEIEEGNFEIEAYIEKFTRKSQGPKHRLLKDGLDPKSVTTKNLLNLVDIIYMPSIRELDDEFKFTTNSTINKLVSTYVIDRIKNEDPEEARYNQIEESVKTLSNFMDHGEQSAFNQLKTSLKNYMLDYSNVELEFRLEPPKIDKLIKDSFEPYIKSNGAELSVDSQGMGYQRSLIFSLICNMADIKIKPSKMVLYLIEEPEIFLHPNHQTHFRNKLMELSQERNNQILLTSHSPYFLNNVNNYSQIKRVYINGNNSILKELTTEYVDKICEINGKLMADAKNAHKLAQGKPEWSETKLAEKAKEIEETDELRYLLWIDPLRANAFLSKKVILVEGPTEKALFSFIFDHDLGMFSSEKKTSEIAVIDTVGKYHFYKFANLLYKLDIPTWIMYDTDVDNEGNNVNERTSISHEKLNEYIENLKENGIILDCLKNHPDIEKSLGFQKEYGSPDISLYQKLVEDYESCRSSDKYNEIRSFVQEIIDY
jgi:putative ATP-dependent endonuclease of the OLD family